MNVPESQVDHNALRTNQAFIIGLLLIGFILDWTPLVVFVGAVMLLGSLLKRPGFVPAYRALRRLGVVEADILRDHPQPHRFAQTVGGVVLAGASAALLSGAASLGWILAWLVIALAALNLFGGFCVGCAIYYWFSRLGLPGFDRSPPPGTVPGRRPSTSEGS
ncbi:MAG: DUF4395 domain-containing protein [Anaerolineales bacterium]|nr:DUF4395 domain-containing protein [Anaerolineales bacterium]